VKEKLLSVSDVEAGRLNTADLDISHINFCELPTESEWKLITCETKGTVYRFVEPFFFFFFFPPTLVYET
jgi:hypothetical protein